MKRTTNQKILDLAGRLKDPDRPRPLLFLGAGCSVTAGLPGLDEFLKEVDAKSLDDLVYRLTHDLELRSAIVRGLDQPTDTSSFEMLACLVSQGFFDTILTTNWDCLIETALSHFLPPDKYRVYVRPEVPDESIANALSREVPRVKLVKLHGDVLCEPIVDPKNLMNYHHSLETRIRALAKEKGLIIIGYGLNEPRINQLLADASPIIVSPSEHKQSTLAQYGRGARHIGNEDGMFYNFIQYLCFELLAQDYCSMTDEAPWLAKGLHALFPKPEHREAVEDIYDRISDYWKLSNLDEESVRDLTKKMLRKIRSEFRHELGEGGSGICLVFILDPLAPGGTEIHRLIRANKELSKLVEGMRIQTVEIAIRYGRGRHVVGWDRPSEEADLSRFGAVVLIDSVAFTGHTLELVRTHLSTEGHREKGEFTAALLLLPRETQERLLSEDDRPEEDWVRWWDVISPKPRFSGFEVTFPWGWTTATLPVSGRTEKARDPFFLLENFAYTPKPWGDQLTLSSNQRLSVSLLLLNRGQRTSTHLHHLRDELFVVLDDRLRISLWDRFLELRKHQSICIPAGVPHALIALNQPCRVLEIATGYYDLALDITRLSDPHDRKRTPDGSDDGLS